MIKNQEDYNGILMIRLLKKGNDVEVSVNSHDRLNDNKPLSLNDLFMCYGTLGEVLMAECNKDPNHAIAKMLLEAFNSTNKKGLIH